MMLRATKPAEAEERSVQRIESDSPARSWPTHQNGIGRADHRAIRTVDPYQVPIIVHCHLRWDFVWQRPQQIFSRLARDHRILFIEEPIWEEEENHLKISEPHQNLVRLIPTLRPQSPTNVDSQCAAALPLLQRALEAHPLLSGRFDRPLQWFYSPMTAPLFLDRLGAVATVYDCMDELANFRFAPPDIGERERLLLSRADLVFAGGYHLFEAKSRAHRNVHFFGCGVDVDHYAKARLDTTPLPPEVVDLPHPIFGYFGVIDERLDYDLLAHLAGQFPSGSVVMVGPLAKVDPHMLPSLPNIHWLGQRAYADLPALVKSFDVCLMPFAINDATRYINPTKTLEYMAAGKPIVSTPVPDVVNNFSPIVQIARSREEFVCSTARAAHSPDPALIKQGIKRADDSSWESTVRAMRAHLIETLKGGGGRKSLAGHSAFP